MCLEKNSAPAEEKCPRCLNIKPIIAMYSIYRRSADPPHEKGVRHFRPFVLLQLQLIAVDLEVSANDVPHRVVGQNSGHVDGVDVVRGLQLRKLTVTLIQNIVQQK